LLATTASKHCVLAASIFLFNTNEATVAANVFAIEEAGAVLVALLKVVS
jgi:hypothetical protein